MNSTIKRDLLEIALRYVSDPRLIEDECDGRKRNETNQDYADRISSSMQRNEDLREFIQELEDSLAAQPQTLDEAMEVSRALAKAYKNGYNAAIAAQPDYRKCEFCGCNTNAKVRACCDKGRSADALAAQPSGPAWHDAPTVPGLWVVKTIAGPEAHNIEPHDIDEVPVGEWCGPLPEDTK